VRALLADPTKPSGLSMTLATYLKEQKALVVGEVARCYVDDAELPYPNEIKVRELIFGAQPSPVLIQGLIHGTTRCRPGLLVIGVVHQFGAWSGSGDRKPSALLLPLVDRAGQPATVPHDNLRVDFNSSGSEAVIGPESALSLEQLRALAASLRR